MLKSHGHLESFKSSLWFVFFPFCFIIVNVAPISDAQLHQKTISYIGKNKARTWSPCS